jgi:ketosteroid isomerase-like protein
MSQENARIARDSVYRFASGNLTGLADLYAPNITIVAPPGWPEGGRFEGRVAVMAQLRRVQEDWAEQTMEIAREKAERDWVVHEILWTVRGARSGVSSQVTVIAAFRVERERIAEILYFWEWRDALKAVGLAE